MEIKGRKTQDRLAKIIWNSRYEMNNARSRSILVLIVCSLMAFAFLGGALMYRSGSLSSLGYTAKAILKDGMPNYIRGKLARPERIYIDIQYKDFQSLLYVRNVALENGTLYGIDNDYVNGKIRYKDDSIRVKIRLKGGMADQHMAGEKWSFRVKIRDDKTLFGMRAFALMDPKRRSNLHEWLLRRVLRMEGIISKRYKFVEVVVNGENKGIYAMDEHHGKVMIEANQRREGPIIRLSQVPFWVEGAFLNFNQGGINEYYLSADIDAIESGKIMRSDILRQQFIEAQNLFNGFRNGDLPAHEVFDIDKMAKWLAVSNVMGAWHGVGAFNMRFYFNPITFKLEPVTDDGYNESYLFKGFGFPEDRLFSLHYNNNSRFFNQLYSDFLFIEKYLQDLERVSRKSYMDNILTVLREDMDENLNILHKDNPYYQFPIGELYKNQEYIRRKLNPYKGIVAYWKEINATSIVLRVGNVKEIPMEILNVTFEDGTRLEPQEGRNILRRKDRFKPLLYKEMEFMLRDGLGGTTSGSKLKVQYKLLGTSRLRSEPVYPWPSYDSNFLSGDFVRQEGNFQDFHFISVDQSSNEILVKQGHWVLNKFLVVPKGYTLIVKAGTNLDLRNGAKILSYSPIRFIGSDKDPIIIKSSDSTGQGLAVLNARKESFLENVVFEKLSEVSFQNGWHLTGAITFYESPVSILKSRFLKIKSEDALNIIRTRFTIKNSLFKQSSSDALDVDFGKGLIQNTSFVNSGNDAIDLSGSAVSLSTIHINGTGDKGISAGEKSEVTANQIVIRNAKVGIASKDMSVINIEDVQIFNTGIGFAAYQKKPEFGPASISIRGAKSINVSTMYLIERRSILELNGTKVEGTQRDVGTGI